MKKVRKRLSYANVMATIAAFLALGGASALAASHLAKNSVGTKQLKAGAVTGAKVKNGSLSGADIQSGTLGRVPTAASAESARSAQSAANATRADSAGNLAGFSRKGMVRATTTLSTEGFAVALASSPAIPLFSSGPFTVYGKCFQFTGTTALETQAFVGIATSEDGAVFQGSDEHLLGNPFLDVNTPEPNRELEGTSVRDNLSEYFGTDDEFGALAPGGAAIEGQLQFGVKRGELPGGNGVFGPGQSCLFSGSMTTLNG